MTVVRGVQRRADVGGKNILSIYSNKTPVGKTLGGATSEPGPSEPHAIAGWLLRFPLGVFIGLCVC